MPATTQLHCLLYFSKITSTEGHNLSSMVRSILTQAQHLNARDHITGLLVFNRSYFAQVLEGAPELVERTYGRISRDARHSLPVIVLKQSIKERTFGAWSMCARQLSGLDNDILDRLEQRGAFPPVSGPGASLLSQLQAIARVHHAAFTRQTKDVHYL